MEITDVILTGAGAPAAEGLPIQSGLFQKFWEENSGRLRGARTAQRSGDGRTAPWDSVLLDLDRYLTIFFGIDPAATKGKSSARFPTFEEALGLLDLALSNREEFWDYPEELIRSTHFHLVALIAASLQDSTPESPQHHIRLIDALSEAGKLASTAFVTTNYDLLLDRALLESLGPGHTDLQIRFRENEDHGGTGPNGQQTALFKLHGSLDWLYCACCRAVDRAPVDTVIPGRSRATPFCACGNLKRPLIVPPSFIKALSNIHLQHLWVQAEAVIGQAHRLIFCGYSLPDADLNIKYLLKRAQLRRGNPSRSHSYTESRQLVHNGQKTWSVIVINHHKGKTKEAIRDEADRYRRFFGQTIDLKYCDFGFEAFAADPTIIDSL